MRLLKNATMSKWENPSTMGNGIWVRTSAWLSANTNRACLRACVCVRTRKGFYCQSVIKKAKLFLIKSCAARNSLCMKLSLYLGEHLFSLNKSLQMHIPTTENEEHLIKAVTWNINCGPS